jgi:CRISPR/Cas system-associated exonuclease Cas4 (RecB family)
MSEQRVWSVSAMRTYVTCPRQWWLSYVAHAPQEQGVASIRGQVLHAGVAAGVAAFDAARKEGRDVVVAIRRMHAAVEHAVCKAAARLGHEEIDEAVDTAIECLNELGPEPGDDILLIEGRMDIEVDGVPITYRADLVYRRAGRVVVRDWKSRKDLPRRRELPRDRQLTLGALCAARTFGVTQVDVEIASIGSGVAVDAPIHPSTAQDTGRVVAEVAGKAEADREFRPRPGAACARCPVQAHCPTVALIGAEILAPGPDGRPSMQRNIPSMYVPIEELAAQVRQAGGVS